MCHIHLAKTLYKMLFLKKVLSFLKFFYKMSNANNGISFLCVFLALFFATLQLTFFLTMKKTKIKI